MNITVKKLEAALTQLRFEAYVGPMGESRNKVMTGVDELLRLPQESKERLANILTEVFSKAD